jgi:hypothetical protein
MEMTGYGVNMDEFEYEYTGKYYIPTTEERKNKMIESQLDCIDIYKIRLAKCTTEKSKKMEQSWIDWTMKEIERIKSDEMAIHQAAKREFLEYVKTKRESIEYVKKKDEVIKTTGYNIEIDIIYDIMGDKAGYKVTTSTGEYVYTVDELEGTNLLNLIESDTVTVYAQDSVMTKDEHRAQYGW